MRTRQQIVEWLKQNGMTMDSSDPFKVVVLELLLDIRDK